MLRLVTYGVRARLSKAAALLLLAAPAQADQVHLLALGDSLTQGYGLIESEGFVPQMRAWLAERGHDVRLVNGGVSGDTTAGGLSRVEWSLTPEIEGMIVALGGNDLLRGLPPEVARENLSGILEVAEAQDVEVLLVGMSAPGNYGADYKAAFDAIYPDLAERYGTLYHPDFLGGLLEDGETPADATDLMQPDGIHPSAEGVARIVATMGPAVEELIARIEE
ncbi:arylesterase [Salipiger mucosus]|uniref:Arylesterase n=1 Tax=Salipiger mucosus DSM 16094 TaxID=1123237 RepID=S9QT34_9RHOB|nr:arylesterase [Salipiger mucosus]EPX82823.1 Arylesterase precursor [Salipiger mucosus DSM 16094]